MGFANPAQSAFQLLDGMTSSQRMRWVLPAYLRLIAMQQMGLNTFPALVEIAKINHSHDPKEFPPAAYVAGIRSATIDDVTSQLLSTSSFKHKGVDDCRLPGSDFESPPSWWPWCFGDWCYRFHTINVAEVLYNEARSENYGAQDAVGWTIRDRAFEALGCDHYPGQNCSTCTWFCNAPGSLCDASKRICSVVHGGTSVPGAGQRQFKDKHRSWDKLVSSGMIFLADIILVGIVPEATPESIQFIPSGMSDCEFSCKGGGYCWTQKEGNGFQEASPQGPMEFLNRVYDAGHAECKHLPVPTTIPPTGFVCPNGSPNNYFWNRSW